MPTLLEYAVGIAGVLLGVAWLVRPATMNRLQTRALYFGKVDAPDEYTDLQLLLGRVSGGVLAALGVALLAGLLP